MSEQARREWQHLCGAAVLRACRQPGLAESALAFAATYDAAELARLKVLGLKPEAAEAKKWYEKARELGAPEAEARLRRLGER